ncbi:MAG: beta-(1-6) glucans synthase, partial [Xanthobacteraceae bacterium]
QLPKFGARSGQLYCLSYAPFRGSQTPLVEGTRVDARQIDEDLTLLAKYTNCIRTYSVDDGRDDVLKSARRYGLKVLHGIWVSHDADKTRQQVQTTIALAKAYPDVIKAIVVGNEVLLRGEMSAATLAAIIRDVKAAVPMPVTYADVWEFWLRYPDVQNAVDFVTVHILPYWEDFPIPASRAAEHVADIRGRVAAAFPEKEIVVGEFGWPSQGRMREGARPSPSNQALALTETLALAAREHFQLNVIEAFDQPWKRALEGTVGGYWGIIDRATGAPKFNLAGGSVSDHPNWPIQAAAGIILAALAFAGAATATRRKSVSVPQWALIADMLFVSAVAFGWTVETVAVESFSIGSWLRSLAFAAAAAAAPIVCAIGCAAGRPVPAFADLIGGRAKHRNGFDWALGAILILTVVVAVEAALGLVFDPRYRDIPFAPLTAAALPYLALSFAAPRSGALRSVAESVAAALLVVCAAYILFNETFANWQAAWFCAGAVVLAVSLARGRDAPGSE